MKWVMLLLLAGAACGPAPGKPCSDESTCGEGMTCARPTVDGSPAAVGVCAPVLGIAGAHCSASAECGKGLFCSNDLPSEVKRRHGSCVTLQPENEPCFRNDNCSSGLVCSKSGGAETGMCKKRPAPADAATVPQQIGAADAGAVDDGASADASGDGASADASGDGASAD